MGKLVDSKLIAEMATTLENDELGGAVRLLTRIMTTGRAVPAERAHIISQLGENRWATSASAILEFFDVFDDEISHAALREASIPSVSAAPRERAGKTQDLPMVCPTRRPVVPNYPDREAPDRVSIKQAAFATMVRLCEAAGQSENTARALLASLLKTWPEGDVYQAVYQAERQGFVADPRSWITASLKKTSQPVVQRARGRETVAAPAKKHQLATPEALGVSTSTADKIRQRNRSLGLNLTINKAGA